MRYHIAGSEELSLRQLMEMLLGEEGRRKLVLRQKRNDELFHLYDTELVLRLRSHKNLDETRKFLRKFQDYLGEFPPSSELAKSFLGAWVTSSRWIRLLVHIVGSSKAVGPFRAHGEARLDLPLSSGYRKCGLPYPRPP